MGARPTKRKWTLALCEAVNTRNLDVTMQLPIGTRSEAIDREVTAALKGAGVTNITFAPETGSERMLEIDEPHERMPAVA